MTYIDNINAEIVNLEEYLRNIPEKYAEAGVFSMYEKRLQELKKLKEKANK